MHRSTAWSALLFVIVVKVLLVVCLYRPGDRTVASGIVVIIVGICNHSRMKTSKSTCAIFGVSIGLDPC